MNKDMCVACDDGILNIRVGAIIMKDGKILMVGNDRDYLYSVGGRVKFGETAEEAVVREVLEETGVQMENDRLGFVHENYFYGDMPSNRNKLIYEISLFFYMKVPDAFAPISESFMEDARTFHLPCGELVRKRSCVREQPLHSYREQNHTRQENPALISAQVPLTLYILLLSAVLFHFQKAHQSPRRRSQARKPFLR